MVADGFKNVAILARQDSYGEGLADQVEEGDQGAGRQGRGLELYSADATNYTAEVNKVAASKPDAIAVIGFEETTKIVPQLISKGIGPQDIPTYFVDGNTADYSKDFDPGTLKGSRRRPIPASRRDPESLQQEARLRSAPEARRTTPTARRSYDATVMAALAATAAGDDPAKPSPSKMIESPGRPACTATRIASTCSGRAKTSTMTASPVPLT